MGTEQVVDGIRIQRIETVVGGYGVLYLQYVFRIAQDLLSVDDALDLVIGKFVSLDSQRGMGRFDAHLAMEPGFRVHAGNSFDLSCQIGCPKSSLAYTGCSRERRTIGDIRCPLSILIDRFRYREIMLPYSILKHSRDPESTSVSRLSF